MNWFNKISQSNYYIDNSTIEGKGVFASKNLKKGESIGPAFNDSIPQLQQEKVDSRTELGRFINHSFAPNANSILDSDLKTLICIIDIPQGTEITTDYLHPRAVQRTGVPDVNRVKHYK